MNSATLHRHATLTSIDVEQVSAPSGGGQAAETYGDPTSIDAFTREETELLQQSDGSFIEVTLKVWVPGTASVLPSEGDRITYSGDTYIVESDKTVENLRSEIDHVKLMCREV